MNTQLTAAYYYPPVHIQPSPLPMFSGFPDLLLHSFLMCHTPKPAPDSASDKQPLPHRLTQVPLFSDCNLPERCHLHCLHIHLHCLYGYRDVTSVAYRHSFFLTLHFLPSLVRFLTLLHHFHFHLHFLLLLHPLPGFPLTLSLLVLPLKFSDIQFL